MIRKIIEGDELVGISMSSYDYPLASNLTKFSENKVAEIYHDLKPSFESARKGVAFIEEIAGLKCSLFPSWHVPIILENKSGHYYLRKLSRRDRKQFLKYINTSLPYIPQNNWLNSPFLDMDDFLGSSFTWEFTEEGHDYWEHLRDTFQWATGSRKSVLSQQEIEDAIYDAGRINI